MPGLAENLARVRERLAGAARRAGRSPDSITLVAVTKGCGSETVRGLWQLGVRDFGENRVQEALPKMALDLPGARWHLIGHLQENKINKILPQVFLIHSLDSLRIAQAVDMRAERLGRRVPVLLEVKTSPEPSKHGVPAGEVPDAWVRLAALPGLELAGLMTIAPLGVAAEGVRESFRTLHRLFEALQSRPMPPRILSMGMSDDLEIAVEEGSTMLRVGRALTSG